MGLYGDLCCFCSRIHRGARNLVDRYDRMYEKLVSPLGLRERGRLLEVRGLSIEFVL